MSTLVEIQEAITNLRDDEKKLLAQWLNSQTEPEMSTQEEQRLLCSLDEAIRDIDAGKGVPIENARKLVTRGLQDNLGPPGHCGPGRNRSPQVDAC